MNTALNRTLDPALLSWVESANDPATDFPIRNLPFGRFRHGVGGHAHRMKTGGAIMHGRRRCIARGTEFDVVGNGASGSSGKLA